jgi:hypothetical protein
MVTSWRPCRLGRVPNVPGPFGCGWPVELPAERRRANAVVGQAQGRRAIPHKACGQMSSDSPHFMGGRSYRALDYLGPRLSLLYIPSRLAGVWVDTIFGNRESAAIPRLVY